MTTRRAFAALALGAGVAWSCRALAQGPGGSDRGLGGTGLLPGDPDPQGDGTRGQDRGIGGTGVIGTIRGFGSIVVNGLRVGYGPGVGVTIDGAPARADDLRLGQVVHVLARHRDGRLSTAAIAVRNEVVGPVESWDGRVLAVLGQRVLFGEGATPPALERGAPVAVSGLRRLDGTVVASLVELRPAGRLRLRGSVAVGPGGVPTLGGRPIPGLDRALAGRRVGLAGGLKDGTFAPDEVEVEPDVPFAGADRLSIEAYVERTAGRLRFGSGLALPAGPGAVAALRAPGPVRAVVLASPARGGGFSADAVRIERAPDRGRDRRAPPGGARTAPPAGRDAVEAPRPQGHPDRAPGPGDRPGGSGHAGPGEAGGGRGRGHR